MKYFLLKLFLFLTLLFVLDRSFILFKIGEKNVFAEIAEKKMVTMSQEIKNSSPELIIMGSSHAQFAVSPEIIYDQCKLSGINLAYGGGGNAGLQLALLSKLLPILPTKPKLILLSLDVFALNPEPIYADKCQSILFREENDFISNLSDKYLVSYFKLYARFIPRYWNQVKTGDFTLPYLKTYTYDLSMFKKYERYEISPSGWVQGYGFLNKNYIRYKNEVFNPNSKAINDLKTFVELCVRNKIQVALIQIPEHATCLAYGKKYSDFDEWIKYNPAVHGIKYYNYNKSVEFPLNNDSLFFDSDHLNKRGAEFFTAELCREIKTLVKPNILSIK